jgi:hypothetical protein
MSKLWAIIGSFALLLAACSAGGEISVETVDAGDGRSDAPGEAAPALAPQAVRAAASRTADVESARFSIAMAITGVPMMGDLDFSFDGLMLEGGERVGMIMDFAPLLEQMGEDAGELDGLLGAESLTIEMRVIGDYMYMRSPLLSLSGMVGADRWVRVDMAKAAEVAGLSETDIGSMTGTPFGIASADTFLAFLEAAGADITDLGMVDIRGTTTQGIATTVRTGDLYDLAADEASEEIQSFLDQLDLGSGLDIELPIEAYIDEDGYVRRFAIHMNMAELADQIGAEMGDELGELGTAMVGDMAMTMSFDMYDFGVEAEIDEPYDFIDLTAEFIAGEF